MFGFEDKEQSVALACPPATLPNGDSNASQVLRWAIDAREMGREFVKASPGYSEIGKSIDIIRGTVVDKLPRKLSRVKANLIKRAIQELIATQANIQPFWSYESDNVDLEKQTQILNRLMQNWFFNTFADREIKKALQWASCGIGYIEPYWKPDFHRKGKGDIALRAHDGRNVWPVYLDGNYELQDSYAVVIYHRMPIINAWRNWPQFQDELKPNRWPSRGLSRAKDALFSAPLLNWMTGRSSSSTEKDPLSAFPTIDVYYIYIDDRRINRTGKTVPMGQPGEPWYYDVPSIDSDLPFGKGTRKAQPEDCYLYPNKRLVICTDQVVLYDGPSRWWHGRFPLIPFSFDKWAWDFAGGSLAQNVSSMQDSVTSLLRAMDDSANARMHPPKIGNKQSGIAKGDVERLNPRIPGQTLMGNLDPGMKPIEFPFPFDYYNIPNYIPDLMKWMVDRVDHDLGLPDARAMMRAKQLPSSDTVQKAIELAGPIAEDMTREMERSFRELGHQTMYLFFEFYTRTRRMNVLGQDIGTDDEDFKVFDPDTLIPSHMPDEDTQVRSRYTRFQRARTHADNFTFRVIPNSLNSLNSMNRKLLMLQVAKSEVLPIDPWTLGEALNINIGQKPAVTSMLERWKVWKEMVIKFQIRMKAAAMKEAEEEGIAEALGMSGNGQGGEGGGSQGEGGNPVGRPSSFTAPPKLEQKADGRTTVTTSK